jgi:hypothetical protein
MVFKPLGGTHPRHLGSETDTATAADDEVADLPGGIFFSAERNGEAAGGLQGLYYKDARSVVRRVRRARGGGFHFAALAANDRFRAIGKVLFVPDVDPRAWASATEKTTAPPPELFALPPGAVFTALGATESSEWQRQGVYGLDRGGLFRRLLKDVVLGLNWSDPIPADRFGQFGQRLSVDDEDPNAGASPA